MRLTIAFAVYGQPAMLAEWFKRFELAGSEETRAAVQVLVVDDCGTPPARVPPYARLLRITKDTPWNQGEARNLAAVQAAGTVLLMLDPDMTFPRDSLDAFVRAAAALEDDKVVRPVLRHVGGNLDSSSPNVYLIHRATFLRCGYDLCYSGHKGYGDVELHDIWNRLYRRKTRDDLVLDFWHGSLVPDAQVITINRNVHHNRKLFHKRHARLQAIGVKAFVKERSEKVRSPWEEVRCST